MVLSVILCKNRVLFTIDSNQHQKQVQKSIATQGLQPLNFTQWPL